MGNHNQFVILIICNCWPLYAITITSSLWPSCPYEQSQPVCYSDITVFVCNHNHFITVSKLSLQAITSLLSWHSCLCMQPQLACYWHSIVLVCNHNWMVIVTAVLMSKHKYLLLWHSKQSQPVYCDIALLTISLLVWHSHPYEQSHNYIVTAVIQAQLIIIVDNSKAKYKIIKVLNSLH